MNTHFKKGASLIIGVLLFGTLHVITVSAQTVDLYANKPAVYNQASVSSGGSFSLEIQNVPAQADLTANISADSGLIATGDAMFYSGYSDWDENGSDVDLSTNDIDLSISDSQGGNYYVDVYPSSDVTNMVITIDYTTNANTAAVINSSSENPATRTNISDSDTVRTITVINVPAGDTLTVNTSGGTGGVDLYVYDSSFTDYCNSDNDLNGNATEESCVLNGVVGGTYSIELSTASTYSGVTVDFSTSSPTTTLLNGEGGTTGQITDTNYEYFKINVPSGASDLYITTNGGTGTYADLYHKYNAKPTTGDYDNNSANAGTNSESILIASPTVGDHYFGVYANGGTVNSVAVTADFTNGSLSKGVDKTGISVSEGEWAHYSFSVPSGVSNLTLTTSGGSGNVDLYTRYNAYPTTATNDGSDTGAGTSKSVVIASPSIGTYTVSVRGGTGGASNITLNADYTPAPTSIYNGVKQTGISGASGEWHYYTITVPSGSTKLKIAMQDEGANNTEAQLYEKLGSNPTTTSYDNVNLETGNNGTVFVDNPSAGTHHIGVYCHPNGGDCGPVSLTAYYTSGSLDISGDSVSPLEVTQNNEWVYYVANVSFGSYTNFTANTSGSTGDTDLYLGYLDFPTTTSNVASSTNVGNTESVFVDPNGGNYYIGLRGNPTFSGVTLSVSSTEGTWVTDDPFPSGEGMDVDSNTNGDFILAGGVVYKRNVRTWNAQGTLVSGATTGAIGGNRAYIDDAGDIKIFEYDSGTETWSLAGSIAGKTLGDAYGVYVVTSDLTIYDCTNPASCSVNGIITDPAEPNGGGSFGFAVATDGNKIIVSDPSYNNDPGNGSIYTGKVYIYNMDGTPDGSPNGFEPSDAGTVSIHFGYSVAIENDQFITGALYGFEGPYTSGTPGGSAYIFKYVGGTWVEQDEITASDANMDQSSGDNFGRSVGIYSNYAIVGAPTRNGPNGNGSAIYLFEKTAGTPDTWNQILEYQFDTFDFGLDVAIVGNYYYAVAGQTPSGAGVVVHNNKSGSSGSGGGSAVPEFSDYVLILSVAIIVAFMFKTVPKIGKTHIGRA